MNSGLYAACSGLLARMQALDTIAGNVANSSTAGFRGERDVFGTVLAERSHAATLSGLNRATNTFSQISGTSLDQSQGLVTRTDNDLDVAIQGDGYFKIQTSNGMAYTRNGHFVLDAKGRLTTQNGDAVLGQTGPIVVGAGKVTVGANGTVSSDGAVVGRLALVAFSPGTELTSHGLGNYSAGGAVERPASDATLQQGALEGSNVSPTEGVVQLISAQREAESMRHALTMLDSEMNKTAVQELSKVG